MRNMTSVGINLFSAGPVHAKISLLILVVEILTILSFSSSSSSFMRSEPCSLYLYQSEVIPGSGFGIIAGRRFAKDELIEPQPGLILPRCWPSQFDNYVFSPPPPDDNSYVLNLLGIGGLLNHQNQFLNTYKGWLTENGVAVERVVNQAKPYSTFDPIGFFASAEILAGQEIFNTYSNDDSWFETHFNTTSAAPPTENFQIPLEKLEERGICLSDVFVSESRIPDAGRGLFANRPFRKGELVTVSPVIMIDKGKALAGGVNFDARENLMLNYMITDVESNVLVHPTGQAILINHAEKSELNIKMEWYARNGPEALAARLEEDPKKMAGMPSSALDIAYIATRDIQKGEELTMFYSEGWQAMWDRYAVTKRDAVLKPSGGEDDFVNNENFLPIFRAFIQAPPSFFPKHWYDIVKNDELKAQDNR